MKLIIGLGNPGEKYKNNRHNMGYMVIDRLKVKSKKLKAVKANTFMNNSGSFVAEQINNFKLKVEDLVIIHDDLDLPLGTWKIQFAKGPKVHGGINDIEQILGTKDFTRIRIGVDGRKPESRISGEDYVLQNFSKEEREILEGVIRQVCAKLSGIF